MEGLELIHDEQIGPIKKVLFERPISKLYNRNIGILAGRNVALKHINDVHEIISALNYNQIIVAESHLKQHGVPAEVYLSETKKISQAYENADQAIEVLNDCNFVVIGLDIEINSRLQIFMEKLINSRPAPIVFTNESIGLFKTSPGLINNRVGDIFVCSTKNLIELSNYLSIPVKFSPNAGIYNKLKMMTNICKHTGSSVVCVEDYQILASNYEHTEQAVVINIANEKKYILDHYFTAVITSLLCDVPNPQTNIIERLLTAGYLVRTSSSAKDSFVKNLSNTLINFK